MTAAPRPAALSERTLVLVFRAAALYNVLWGATVVLFPTLLFALLRVPAPNYPFLMSGIGMFVAIFGYGYWVVSRDLWGYPQLDVIGLLGKIIGPLAWLFTVSRGEIPARTLLVNVFNDVVWLPFFIAYVASNYRAGQSRPALTQ